MCHLKNALYFLCLCLCCCFPAQKRGKDYSNILRSTNIYEIDAFLRTAHPDEPKRSVLKPRLIKMLKEYIQNAHPADQRVKDFQEKLALLRRKPSTRISFQEMNEIIKQKQITKFKQVLEPKDKSYVTKSYGNTVSGHVSGPAVTDNPEEEEFKLLMSVNPVEHKNNTVKILNSLFDNDPNSKESIVMIENKSDCNIIMRIEGVGNTKYRLAIPARGDNTIVVAKGDYLFSSLLCGAQYASQKTVQKAIMVALGE
ncbi:MAG: hypothetical protein L6264_12170 [Weeksellaceae bacterium]|nr:hypothetical protein [Bacteroidota bacterium]MCG2781694.1 hypothetical protein [Weeksellaceae bacterium]